MTTVSERISIIVFAVVILGWIVFTAVFLARKKPPKAPERKRDRASIAGIVIQGFGFAIVWAVRRPFFTPIATDNLALNISLAIVTVALVVGSLWMIITAVRVLGKQWSFAARLIEEHELVKEGPYHIVRHPIYTGMFGMLIATALALSHWIGLIIGIVVFMVGTSMRVRSEEKLLRDAFGRAYEEYAQQVPAVVPLSRGVRSSR